MTYIHTSFLYWKNQASGRFRKEKTKQWSHYHRARKYARKAASKDRQGLSFSENSELYEHYKNLLSRNIGTTRDRKHVADDIAAHRITQKYSRWRKQFTFKIGQVIIVTEKLQGYGRVFDLPEGTHLQIVDMIYGTDPQETPLLSVALWETMETIRYQSGHPVLYDSDWFIPSHPKGYTEVPCSAEIAGLDID